MKKSDMLKDHETAEIHHFGNVLLNARVIYMGLSPELNQTVIAILCHYRLTWRLNLKTLKWWSRDFLGETDQFLEEWIQRCKHRGFYGATEWTRFWKKPIKFWKNVFENRYHILDYDFSLNIACSTICCPNTNTRDVPMKDWENPQKVSLCCMQYP